MGRKKASDDIPKQTRRIRPAISPEAREQQMIGLAVDLAERQLLDGTASSQVITHFLKLATEKERTECEILKKRKDLIVAQTEALHAAQRMEELYKDAMVSLRKYSGHGGDEEYEPDENL